MASRTRGGYLSDEFDSDLGILKKETVYNRNYESVFQHRRADSIDREPGELYSDDDTDSDGAIRSEITFNQCIGFNNLDNGIKLSSVKNSRKLSPVVWVKDDRKLTRPLKRRHISPSPETDVCVSQVSPSGGSTADRDDYVPMRTVMSSRWANEADEGEISDYTDARITSRNSGSGSNEVMLRKSISPDIGEVGRGVRSSSRDSFADNCDKNCYDKIDDGRSESDSEFDCADQQPKVRVNMLQSCRYVDEFERLNEINEGTYGVVSRARDKKTGEIVALKKVKMEKEREGFPVTSLREINILLSIRHPSIVDVKEVVMGRNNFDCIYMVMEYMEHDLKGLLETIKQPFSQSEVKCLMLQLLSGVKYLHDNWVIHRDLKTSNLLFDNSGNLKICDFGMARQYGSPLKPYTQLVVTLWYRAPEILLGSKQYSTAIDMWSVGCIMAELLSKEPLFNGKNELDQLDKIFRVLGSPNETIWPGCTKLPGYKVNFVRNQYNLLRRKFPATSFTGSPVLSDAGYDLLSKLLTYDPEKRITAEAALNHEWFREVPLPKSKEIMPTYPSQNDQDRRLRRGVKRPDPLKEQWRNELQQGELGTGGLFGQ